MNKIEKRRNKKLLRNYGINNAEYEEMLANQFGLCKICGKNSKLLVDHSHKTGQIRGLLCIRCNSSLGWFEQYESMIIRYLWR
jgi:hypothetical protein